MSSARRLPVIRASSASTYEADAVIIVILFTNVCNIQFCSQWFDLNLEKCRIEKNARRQ